MLMYVWSDHYADDSNGADFQHKPRREPTARERERRREKEKEKSKVLWQSANYERVERWACVRGFHTTIIQRTHRHRYTVVVQRIVFEVQTRTSNKALMWKSRETHNRCGRLQATTKWLRSRGYQVKTELLSVTWCANNVNNSSRQCLHYNAGYDLYKWVRSFALTNVRKHTFPRNYAYPNDRELQGINTQLSSRIRNTS